MPVLIIEPYYGDSHKRLIEGMQKYLSFEFDVITMPPRKWKWRMRGAALHIAELLKNAEPVDTLFCSSFLNLTDLIALAPPWVREARKIVYFHENQLVYPSRLYKEWDFHFGLTNITTALAADLVIFNSNYNKNTFLQEIPTLLQKFPDYRPEGVSERIAEKSSVLPPPLDPEEFENFPEMQRSGPARIVWNHRWEFDKDPDTFFYALFALQEQNIEFELVVLGEKFKDYPPIFDEAQERLKEHIVQFGYAESRQEYLDALTQCDIVISTAQHEFFGISVMEAVRAGCVPLLPNRLVYPELFGEQYLYEEGELTDRLFEWITIIDKIRQQNLRPIAQFYEWPQWVERYNKIFK